MTEKMNLNWRECQTGNWIAPLPAIPGYPYGGTFLSLAHCVWLIEPCWNTWNITDVWTFAIGLHLKNGEYVSLTNEDFNIPGTATMEELKQTVENLTVEDIATAFQKKGYRPVTG